MDGNGLATNLPFSPEHTAVRVRALLLHSGMTKKDFAATLALSPAQVSHLINAEYAPSPAIVYRMIRAFGVTGDWLIYDNASTISDVTLRNELLKLIPRAKQEFEASRKPAQ